MRNFGIFSFHKFWKLKKNHGLENTIFWNSDQKNRKKSYLQSFLSRRWKIKKRLGVIWYDVFLTFIFNRLSFDPCLRLMKSFLNLRFWRGQSPHSISKQAYFISISEHCNWRHNALEYKVIVPRNWFLLLSINLSTYLWSSYEFK